MSEISEIKSPGGEEYYGIVREKKKWVRPAAIVVSLFMIYYSIGQRMYLGIALAILVIMATFFRKQLVVYDKGVELRYFMKFADHIDLWPWSDITTVHRDLYSSGGIAMHFGKGALTRTFFMSRPDSDKVLALARRMNPSALVADMPKDESASRSPRRR